jgi:nitroreductase
MEVSEALCTRRSVRRYQDRPVPEDLIEKLLRAAMNAPSARNAQPWQFVVLTDRHVLTQVPSISPYAAMAAEAPLAILIGGDLRLEQLAGYWMLDCSAAAQSMLREAHGLRLDAVWTGAYPRQDWMEGYRRLLKLPETVIPHSLIVAGYPAENLSSEDRYRPDRVHRNGWQVQS